MRLVSRTINWQSLDLPEEEVDEEEAEEEVEGGGGGGARASSLSSSIASSLLSLSLFPLSSCGLSELELLLLLRVVLEDNAPALALELGDSRLRGKTAASIWESRPQERAVGYRDVRRIFPLRDPTSLNLKEEEKEDKTEKEKEEKEDKAKEKEMEEKEDKVKEKHDEMRR